MLELYQHDLSDIWDQDLDAHGEYGYPLDKFWTNPICTPFVFLVDGKYAGCALVNRTCHLDGDDWWMSQFFVVKKYRGRGIGQQAAKFIFDAIRGRWEVGQLAANRPAILFWNKVISRYTNDAFRELDFADETFKGKLQCFDNTLVPA